MRVGEDSLAGAHLGIAVLPCGVESGVAPRRQDISGTNSVATPKENSADLRKTAEETQAV
jgi:hypothetical protein